LSMQTYEDMPESLECNTDYEDAELYGWRCFGNLTNIQKGSNTFYLACKDQPWLDETNTSRNPSTIYPLTIIKTENPLVISSVLPNRTIIEGVEPVSVTLEARTSGGVNGDAKCFFSFTGYDNMIEFKHTFSNYHWQILNQMIRGNYILYVKCIDEAGNQARASSSFKINVDEEAPIILRVYGQGLLKVITNEDSSCVYTHTSCRFAWENATLMSGLGKEHYAEWLLGKTYYIRCKDIWENKQDECGIIVKAERGIEVQ